MILTIKYHQYIFSITLSEEYFAGVKSNLSSHGHWICDTKCVAQYKESVSKGKVLTSSEGQGHSII